jgi:hypothetical protein
MGKTDAIGNVDVLRSRTLYVVRKRRVAGLPGSPPELRWPQTLRRELHEEGIRPRLVHEGAAAEVDRYVVITGRYDIAGRVRSDSPAVVVVARSRAFRPDVRRIGPNFATKTS